MGGGVREYSLAAKLLLLDEAIPVCKRVSSGPSVSALSQSLKAKAQPSRVSGRLQRRWRAADPRGKEWPSRLGPARDHQGERRRGQHGVKVAEEGRVGNRKPGLASSMKNKLDGTARLKLRPLSLSLSYVLNRTRFAHGESCQWAVSVFVIILLKGQFNTEVNCWQS